jgi:peptidoglycan L-alanyl-D-glutamate endopeptidase CwlK
MFFLGMQSEKNLEGVDPSLVMCVRRALALSTVDFSVVDGLRTEAEQVVNVANGASRTMHSYHLTGRAVDLAPWVNGKRLWQTPLAVQVAIAMREAAAHFGLTLTWGGVWDRRLGQLDPTDLMGEVGEYVARYQAARPANANGKKPLPLFDPWHHQLEAA